MDFLELFVLLVFFSFFFKSYHLLSLLIGLEMAVILIFFYMSFSVNFFSMYMLLIFISITACESALGLILFIYFNRFFSKDYILHVGVLSF